MNATVEVVVSWPANSSVMTSSRTCWSLSCEPSSSWASSSSERMSSPRSPVRRAALDLVVDERVEALARLHQARERRARATQDLEEVVARPEAQRVLEVGRRVGLARERTVGIKAEQRAHGDAQREPA